MRERHDFDDATPITIRTWFCPRCKASKTNVFKPKPNQRNPTVNTAYGHSGMPSGVIGLFNVHTVWTDRVMPFVGGLWALLWLPFVGVQVTITTLWGAAYKRGGPLPRLPRFGGAFAADVRDDHLLPWTLWCGLGIPVLWLAVGRTLAPTWSVILAYNALRIGPMYTHFSHVYTLCHMEVHRRYQLFRCRGPWGVVWNGWIGLFHGVLPGTFTHSHIRNHHRFNNDVHDLYSTLGYRRDSLVSLARYFVTWFAYACNVSTLYDFWSRRMVRPFVETTVATLYYAGFVYMCVALTNPTYVLWTVGYAFVEGNLLLAIVNFTWHMFYEEGNEFVNSTTIEHGEDFIFSEEYHVVHHQAPGFHHTRYRAHYEKHRQRYDLVFENVNLFEMGFTAIFQNYERLAAMVKDRNEDTVELLKRRLRQTAW